MLLDAASCLAIDLSASWMIGDKSCDIEAAVRAGLRGAIHVATGYGAKIRPEIVEKSRRLISGGPVISFSKDLPEAVDHIFQRVSPKPCFQNRES